MTLLARKAWRLAALTPLGRRLGLDRAYRSECYRRFVEAKRFAEGSLDRRDHDAVSRAYVAFLRSGLTEHERDRLEREDMLVRLCGERDALRRENVRLRTALAVVADAAASVRGPAA